MTLQLFGHDFSSYTMKAKIPLYENATSFEFRPLGEDHPENGRQLVERWPLGLFPLLLDGDTSVFEATTVVEYLDTFHPGPVRMIPEDPRAALQVRMLDRVFDNYVMNVMQVFVSNALRPIEHRDPYGVEQAGKRLDTIYAWLDDLLAGRTWAAGESFSLADAAAAPSLFYADWVHPLGNYLNLAAYRGRLLARPSFARCVEEARPYRSGFPLGAPDRD